MKSEMNHMKTNIIAVDFDLLWYTAAEEYWGVYIVFFQRVLFVWYTIKLGLI